MITIRKCMFIIIMLALLPASSCVQKGYESESRGIAEAMNLDRKVGQLIMVAVPGTGMNPALKSILKNFQPGGIILFGYNLKTFDANRKFISDMQDYSMRHSGVPLFISIDQEGGRVARITSGTTQFPGNMAAGSGGDCGLVRRWGRILGLELRKTGVNMNLSPVLDVNNNPFNPVINTRSFGPDAGVAATLGACYIRGLQESKCIAVGKHFPGHGDTNNDSHLTLPVIHHNMKRLEAVELVPFKRAIGAGVEAIMTAHISYPEILGDNEPATLSPFFLTRMLRDDMSFKGMIITDDLEMAAISNRQDIGEAAVKSILAGSDIVLISSHGANIPLIAGAIRKAVLEKRISMKRLTESACRILEAKLRYKVMAHENGKVRADDISFSEKETMVLDEAERVNSALSRGGIYYFGDTGLLHPGRDATRLFITPNALLKQVISENKTAIFCSADDLPRYDGRRGKKIILYLHVDQPDMDRIRAIAAMSKKMGIHLVLVSSGNPYPVTVSGIVQAGLLSFSNTKESIRQLGICLNGGFNPVTGSGNHLGIAK